MYPSPYSGLARNIHLCNKHKTNWWLWI